MLEPHSFQATKDTHWYCQHSFVNTTQGILCSGLFKPDLTNSGHPELPIDCFLSFVRALCKAFIIDIDPVRLYIAPKPLPTHGIMDRANNVSNTDPRRAPQFVPRPTFGLWDAIFFLDKEATSLIEADEVVFGHWDDYADQAINTLHQMIIQTEMLVFSDDEYTDLVRTFQAFPHRPNLSTVLRDNLYDEHEILINDLSDLTPTPVQKVWHMWATRIEEIHRGLAEKMSRCKLRLAKQDEGDFGLGKLSISVDPPRSESLTGLLHLMLDSASEADDQPEYPETGLEGHLQLMGF